MRAVLDTTVYVSAAISAGANHRIVQAFLDEGFFQAITSPKLLEEIRGVLLRPRFGLSQGPVDRYLTALYFNGELWPDLPDPPSRCRDVNDDYLLALAIESQADVLVSENRDVLDLAPLQDSIPILTSAAFLGLLRRGGLQD